MSNKLKKHLAALDAATTGNANDVIKTAMDGLSGLRDLFKSKGGNFGGAPSSSSSTTSSSSADSSSSEPGGRPVKKSTVQGSTATTAAGVNNDVLTDNSSSETDPAGPGRGHAQIANHGERVKGGGAVAKSTTGFPFDGLRFEKSVQDIEESHGDVLDASPVLVDFSRSMRKLAKSTGAGMEELQGSIMVVAKALEKSLRAQASMAAELQLIKKEPVTTPASGFVVLEKSARGDKGRTLSKSDIAAAIEDAINETSDEEVSRGLAKSMAKLGSAKTTEDITAIVELLPPAVRERL